MTTARTFEEGRRYTSENELDGEGREIKICRRMDDGRVSVSGCGYLAKRLPVEVDGSGNESVSLTVSDHDGNGTTLVFRA